MFRRNKIAVPEWASVLGSKQYPPFIEAVEDFFKNKGEPYAIGDGMVRLEEDGWEFGLSNLAQICAGGKPADYPTMVAHHFGLVLAGKAFEEEFKEKVADFDQVRQYLAVRLYDRDYLAIMGDDALVRRTFAGELFIVLVWDFPTILRNVNQSEIDLWGKSPDELFDIGMANVRTNYELKAEAVDIGGDTLYCVETEHFFATNILLELDSHPEFVGKGGTVFAAPTRSMAMIYPIQDMKVVNALTVFFRSVTKFYTQGPGSLTCQIYWLRDGQFEVLDYEVGSKISFTPSDAFLALLNGGLE